MNSLLGRPTGSPRRNKKNHNPKPGRPTGSPLHKPRVLVTAGPTREYLDPVRYLTNNSSGEMGILIANTFAAAGAQVHLVLGPTVLAPSKKVLISRVTTALQMHSAVRKHITNADIFIATAAVSDFRFEKISSRKLKKEAQTHLRVAMVRNPDILAQIGVWKMKTKRQKPLLVGFALETDHLKKHALKKLKEKNLDLIIGNSPASFSSHSIQPLWIERGTTPKKMPTMSKKNLAKALFRWFRTN